MSGGIGAYGKIPALGDFFRIDLEQSFIGPWDTWLQTAMEGARTRLGDRWEDCYMSAPIWRFTLAEGVAGPRAMVGIMMPSVDRVGRKFPLVLGGPATDATSLRSHFAYAGLHSTLEATALSTLDDTHTRDALASALADLGEPARDPPVTLRAGTDATTVRAAAPEGLGAAFLSAGTGADANAIWSTHLDGDYRLLLAGGLPEGTAAGALFDLDAAIWESSP